MFSVATNKMFTAAYTVLACLLPLVALAQDTGVDSNAGASGSDQGAFSLSKGGLVAIITVVAVVAVLGSKSTIERPVKRHVELINGFSRIRRTLLCGQEASMGGAKVDQACLKTHYQQDRFEKEPGEAERYQAIKKTRNCSSAIPTSIFAAQRP